MAKRYRRPRYGRDAIDREFARNPRPKGRTDRILTIGGVISERNGNVASVTTEYQSEDEDRNPRTVNIMTAGRCSNGHVVSDQNPIAGFCSIPGCGKILCSVRGCCYSCYRCGRTIGREHAVFYRAGEKFQIYCSRTRCRLSYFLDYWFGLGV